MKMSNRTVLNLCIIVNLSGLLIGCVLLPKENMTNSSADFNVVVENSQNQMLLRNILRASKRYPLYFTSFNLLRGNLSYNVSTGTLNIPFGSIGTGYNGAYSIGPTASMSTSPSFDLAVLDNQEFYTRHNAPVPMCTLDYYWHQGWPKQMLMP
ncbi:MAG: hypothetical protein CSYNP_02121 [Syntrophus sp. SKADARSKE-3]|nr:hypothetical protein [Syntrophus sp. SKADARSKE-3]